MRRERCSACGGVFPFNEMFIVGGSPMCAQCAGSAVERGVGGEAGAGAGAARPEIRPCIDPTVCANCGRDNGNLPFATLGGLPTCEQCTTFFRNRPFPYWIKVALAGLAIVVAFSMISNWRFLMAHIELSRASSTVDLAEAMTLYESAMRRVPETDVIRPVYLFAKGVYLLEDLERPAEALAVLEECRNDLPQSYGYEVDLFIRSARCAVAIQSRDWDTFLKIAHADRLDDPDDPYAWGREATANTYKFRETGDSTYLVRAVALLDSARGRAAGDSDYAAYDSLFREQLLSSKPAGPLRSGSAGDYAPQAAPGESPGKE